MTESATLSMFVVRHCEAYNAEAIQMLYLFFAPDRFVASLRAMTESVTLVARHCEAYNAEAIQMLY